MADRYRNSEYDFTSPHFDPEAALRNPIPVPDSGQYNNLAEFLSNSRRRRSGSQNLNSSGEARTSRSSSTFLSESTYRRPLSSSGNQHARPSPHSRTGHRNRAHESSWEVDERSGHKGISSRFNSFGSLRTQREVCSPSGESETQKAPLATVLTLMEARYTEGPLRLLSQCLDQGKKVKVFLRNFKEIRAICSGYVTSFDRHFNMTLQNVDEVFVKPKKQKTPFFEPVNRVSAESICAQQRSEANYIGASEEINKCKHNKTNRLCKECLNSLSTLDDTNIIPYIELAKNTKKWHKSCEIVKRHLPHVFIRGDNVVLVSTGALMSD